MNQEHKAFLEYLFDQCGFRNSSGLVDHLAFEFDLDKKTARAAVEEWKELHPDEYEQVNWDAIRAELDLSA